MADLDDRFSEMIRTFEAARSAVQEELDRLEDGQIDPEHSQKLLQNIIAFEAQAEAMLSMMLDRNAYMDQFVAGEVLVAFFRQAQERLLAHMDRKSG